jgi:hypothetical protein
MEYAYESSLTVYLELGEEFPYDGGELIYVSSSWRISYQKHNQLTRT